MEEGMARYERKAVREGPYASFMPRCLCANDVKLELVVETYRDGTIHYLLGCEACGKLGPKHLQSRLVSAANKATAKPYRAS